MITNDSSNITLWWDVLFFWDAMIFCNNFARWLQKIVATCHVMCWFFWGVLGWFFWICLVRFSGICWFSGMLWSFVQLCKMITKDSGNMWCVGFSGVCWFFGDAMILCNNFTRWLQNIVATSHWDAMCCFSWMLWSFVTTLQDDYKR
jgi:hypothetical protein